MLPGELKPVLTALVLPPAGPLLLIAFGGLLAMLRGRRLAWLAAFTGTVSLWLLSCQAVAVWLSLNLLPQVAPTTPQALAAARVQAIVVLGGGIEASAPEYGRAQPSSPTLVRLRYGAHLARSTGIPLGFSSGVGWANSGAVVATEADAATFALTEWQQKPRWIDDQSRDTAENAQHMKKLLARDGITRIALVTHAWHMPRSVHHFTAQGFTVIAAPTAYVLPRGRTVMDWLPSTAALDDSRAVLREWLALRLL